MTDDAPETRRGPFRLATGGRLIDRAFPAAFSFDRRNLRGFAGDTLASALLGAGIALVGRSFKYHRPRGLLASGMEEPNALFGLGEGNRFEPNRRATTTALASGMVVTSQNAWPSRDLDFGAINNTLWRFFPAGFYYKTFMQPRAAWLRLFEPIIRRSAGLGRPPQEPDPDRYEQAYGFAETVVVGGGIAGLTAARDAAQAGGRVLVLEQAPDWGGRTPVDLDDGDARIATLVEELAALPNVTLRRNTQATGVYDHGYLLALETLAENEPDAGLPRQRLWRIRAGRIITATGALERPLVFSGNDIPGVMLASAVRDYIVNWAVSPGRRIVVVTNNDDAYRTALAALDAGVEIAAVVDARLSSSGALPQEVRARGVPVMFGTGIAAVHGHKLVSGVELCAQDGAGAVTGKVECDCVAMSGGWSPVVHLWSHCGGKLLWDEGIGGFRPDPARPPTGDQGTANVETVGAAAGDLMQVHLTDAAIEGAMEPVWLMPAQATRKARYKMWLDYQNDVKASDVELAAQEGFVSVEHAKRYTTLGMATDQGKTSNINGLVVLSNALGQAPAQTGTTTFRPPYTPLTLGAIAAEARGSLFMPMRRTPIHEWHESHGAVFEPVAMWRRAYAYPQGGETVTDAIHREILAVRKGVGMMDASTLGKLIVKGPDAGRLVDMLYTGMMSSLAVGRIRYGLMCNDNGFLTDDGVVLRLAEDTFLLNTTSGGADNVHAHMEDWLQCEWFDWKVYTANVTEQWAQIAVAGPEARTVLERLGGMDLSADTLPFMSFAEGELGGFPVRVCRISFSGELSFEISTPARHGRALWEAIAAAGRTFGITPYGTEAMHVMRAEKGYIMIGDETDGTVIPQDLGLNWAISKKKTDYLGKRAQMRVEETRPDRWRLVGLESLDGTVLPEGAYAVAEGNNAAGQRNVQGRVTSTYASPTLGRPIAMGLVAHGPERMGEILEFPVPGGVAVKARIVDQVFYDKEGTRTNG